jgi:hypothetical protein
MTRPDVTRAMRIAHPRRRRPFAWFGQFFQVIKNIIVFLPPRRGIRYDPGAARGSNKPAEIRVTKRKKA